MAQPMRGLPVSVSRTMGARQAEDTAVTSLLFFGCFLNLRDSFFPRLIDQLQGDRTQLCLSHRQYPFYSLLWPSLLWCRKGLNIWQGCGEQGKDTWK